MESIGSVAAMYKRTSSTTSTTSSDFATFEVDSGYLGEQILACNGIQAYDDYCQILEAIKTAQHEANMHQRQAKHACKSAIRATANRFLKIESKIEMKLVGFLYNAIEKAVYGQARP